MVSTTFGRETTSPNPLGDIWDVETCGNDRRTNNKDFKLGSRSDSSKV